MLLPLVTAFHKGGVARVAALLRWLADKGEDLVGDHLIEDQQRAFEVEARRQSLAIAQRALDPTSDEARFAADVLPSSVRYVKNGAAGRWWKSARANGQLHAGWLEVPGDLLESRDLAAIEPLVRAWSEGRAGATQDFNALRALLVHPSQHVWVTFQDGCMWWCTVRDEITVNPQGETNDCGHFWLTCSSRWSNRSVGGLRQLVMTELPGIVTATSGYRATVCKPKGWTEILRIIRNDEDADARLAALARQAYEDAVATLIARLGDKDFEVLVDLILSRTGWARIASRGGVTEGIDVEVENPTSGEIAFVQVKSSADQSVLDDYVSRFNDRKDRYSRMIFAVHSPNGNLTPPAGQPVSVWMRKQIAALVVKLGLGDWVAKRL